MPLSDPELDEVISLARHGKLSELKVKSAGKDYLLRRANDEAGDTAIMIAAQHGRINIVQWCVKEKNISLQIKNECGELLQHKIAASGNHDLLQWFLAEVDENFDISACDHAGRNMLHHAFGCLVPNQNLPVFAYQQKNLLKLLFKAIKNQIVATGDRNKIYEKHDNCGFSPVHYLCRLKSSKLFEDWCLIGGAPINAKVVKARDIFFEGMNAAHLMAFYGDFESLSRALLTKKVSLQDRDAQKRTPLVLAAQQGYSECCTILLDWGASLYEAGSNKRNAFLMASLHGHIALLKEMLAVDNHLLVSTDKQGNTALLLAAIGKQRAVIEFLVTQNVSLQETNHAGSTVLHLAALSGDADLLMWCLAAANCDNEARDNKGNTVLHYVMNSKNFKPEQKTALVENIIKLAPGLEKIKSKGILPIVGGKTPGALARRQRLMAVVELIKEAKRGGRQPISNDALTYIAQKMQDRAYQIPPDNLLFKEKKIGMGEYSETYMGTLTIPSATEDEMPRQYAVAIKKTQAEALNISMGSDLLKMVRRDLQALAGLRHPNILHLFGYSFYRDAQGKEFYYLVTELMLFSLHDFIVNRSQALTAYVAIDIAAQVLEGLAYLHQHIDAEGVARSRVHGNLTSANVLLSQTSDDGDNILAKISDFGQSKIRGMTTAVQTVRDQEMVDSATVDVAYQAPEIIENPQKLSTPASDMYSYGMILCALHLKSEPYAGMDGFAIMERGLEYDEERNIRDERIEAPSSEMNAEVVTIIKSCWRGTASLRPTADSLLPEISRIRAEQQANDDADTWSDFTDDGDLAVLAKTPTMMN